MKIAIIGAGIGGLTLALALRARGIEVTLYEQAAELSEIGAAVALSANATRELQRLGLIDQLERTGVEPTELIYRDGLSGDRLASHAVRKGGAYRDRFGAPYLGIHRADLQTTLGRAVGAEHIHLAHRLERIEPMGEGVALHFVGRDPVDADIVVGADGVRSITRQWVGGQPLRYSGTSAFRGIVPVERLDALPDPQAIQFWIGQDAHLLHYAIGSDGGHVNFFAVVEGPTAWPDRGGTMPIEPGEAVAAFADWHPAVRQMVAAGDVERRWGLFVAPPLRHWHRGPVVLIGDAVHAMLPHHGQGANTTIEDAITLATMLDGLTSSNRDARFAAYQKERALRTRLIQRSSWDANRALHTDAGLPDATRHRAMHRFPERYGWIHKFDASARLSGMPDAGAMRH